MKPRSVFTVFYWVFGLIGGLFLIAAAAVFALDVDILALKLCFSIIGLTFTGVALLFVRLDGADARKGRRLMRTGECIDAEIVEAELNGTLSVNGRCPYRLVCKYTENGVNYICRSGNIWHYPECRSNMVRIWRNPANYKDYYVDLPSALIETVEL